MEITMDTKTKLQDSLKDAMRANDEVCKRTIRMALTAIRLAEVEKGGPLDEPGLVAILHKEIKGRKEAIQDAQKAMRPDLIADNEAEIRVLETYLPAQLSDETLQSMVRDAIGEVGAKTPADIGKVMKVLLPRVQGQAPNDKVSQLVKQALTNS
jgi:uncharacterized protein YqeY